MDYASRKFWYFKNLYHCKQNGWILITHEYMRTHFQELKDNISARFIEQFEIGETNITDIDNVEQYFIPDDIFDSLEKKLGSRTKMLLYLNSHCEERLSKALNDIFLTIRMRHTDDIQAIFHCIEPFEDIKRIAISNNATLIPYSFSALRKPHGYQQTLYHTNLNGKYWDSKECEMRFYSFLKEEYDKLPLFSNQELLAIFGKKRTLPLIPLMGVKPKYEALVCCGCFALFPQTFEKDSIVDDDVFYECKKRYSKDQLLVRSHAAHLDEIRVNRCNVRNDPASTILSCKRMIALQSQILLKAILWNRTPITIGHSLPFSFLCSDDFMSEHKVDNIAVNYYLFGYLIPSGLMFSDSYWKWRLNNPTEIEIYLCHLTFICKQLSIDEHKIRSLSGTDRFKYLLNCRQCDKQLVEELTSGQEPNNIDWAVTSSKFVAVKDNAETTFWRLNRVNSAGSIETDLLVDDNPNIIRFYPFDDLAGFVRVFSITINGQVFNDYCDTDYRYMPKDNGYIELRIPNDITSSKTNITINWVYKTVEDFLNSK